MPVRSATLRPTAVFVSWKAGRQCMKRTRGLPVRSSGDAFTWYGRSSSARSWARSCTSLSDQSASGAQMRTSDIPLAGSRR